MSTTPPTDGSGDTMWPPRRADTVPFTWGEVLVTYDSGCVVHLPHTADRFDIGVAVRRTEWGFDCDPAPGELKLTAAWGRLLTFREAWEYECANRGEDPADGPPPKWWPGEGTPSWTPCEPGEGDEIWLVQEANA